MKNRVIIFGSTDTGQRIYKDIKDEAEVLFFVDEDNRIWGKKIHGIIVKNPEEIKNTDFDFIYIGVLTYYREAAALLEQMGIPRGKVISRYVEVPFYARIECLKSIRHMLDEDGIQNGSAAELGVYQGEFAKEINRIFPERNLYLFDTFEGFFEQDCNVEVERGYAEQNRKGYFSNTSEQLVLSKMKHPQMCHICRGFFPESADQIDEEFIFVNLDADLYAPTLAGLEYFYPRMVEGGVIMVHDYFSKAFFGAKAAVREYCSKNRIQYLPIGDTLSIAIRK